MGISSSRLWPIAAASGDVTASPLTEALRSFPGADAGSGKCLSAATVSFLAGAKLLHFTPHSVPLRGSFRARCQLKIGDNLCAVRAAPPSRHLTSERSGLLDHVARIGANRVGKVEKFHNVDAPLNALDRGNERLIQF